MTKEKIILTTATILIASLDITTNVFSQREQPVTFKKNGQQLVGMLHLPDAASEVAQAPAVLMLHGFTGHKAETHFLYTRLARELAHAGIAALRFDFTGSGDSEGEFADMTILTELEDAKVALDFLLNQVEIAPDNVGLLGFSMGGCVAALLAGAGPEFKTMVLWAPVAFPEQTFRYIAASGSGKIFRGEKIYDRGGYYVGQAFMDALPQIKPLAAVADYSAPVLVIQGSEDQSVSQTSGEAYFRIFRKNNSRSQLKLIEREGHTFASLEGTDKIVKRTVDWFVKYLE